MPGASWSPGIAADLRAQILTVQWSREPACPSVPDLEQRYEVNRDTLAGPPARAVGWSVRRRMRRAK